MISYVWFFTLFVVALKGDSTRSDRRRSVKKANHKIDLEHDFLCFIVQCRSRRRRVRNMELRESRVDHSLGRIVKVPLALIHGTRISDPDAGKIASIVARGCAPIRGSRITCRHAFHSQK